jgi:quercetin dioxygenase-like cupin family protein
LTGRVLFQVQGEQSRELGPGDAVHEPADTPILHFDAIGESTTFVACFLLAEGEENTLRILDA